jgi:hypothetical protein
MKTKTLLLLAGSISLLSFTVLTGAGNDLTQMSLKGKVKSFRCNHFKATGEGTNVQKGEPAEASGNVSILFNPDGYKTDETVYLVKDFILSKIKYSYDAKGRLIEDDCNKQDGTLIAKNTYQYDDKGNMIEQKVYRTDTYVQEDHTYTYDAKGYLIEQGNRVMDTKWTVKYKNNEQGLCTAEQSFDAAGKETSKKVMHYNTNGKLVLQESSQWNKKKDSMIVVAKSTYVYDAKGLKVGGDDYVSIKDGPLQLDTKYYYRYDDNGNEIMETWTGGNGKILRDQTWKYDYDATGNWTRSIRYDSGKAVWIVEQTITYY